MIDIALSLLATLLMPVAILLAVSVTQRLLGRPWPARKQFCIDAAQAAAITVAITFTVSLILNGLSVFEWFFFQPSRHDYGVQRELKLSPEEVNFTSHDGTRLHGWFLPANKAAVGTLIHLHGSGRNITYTIGHCAWLRDHGFNVFAFDYRGYGQSAGKPTRQGTVDDAIAAIDHVRSRPDVDTNKICLWGQSMGGQLAIMAAASSKTKGIRAVVSEATYANHSFHIKDKTAQLGPLWLIQWGPWIVTSDTLAAERMVGQLPPTQVLLVHGTDDSGVLPYHSERLYERAKMPKDIWRIEGGKHLDAFRSQSLRTKLMEYLTHACETD